MAKSPAIKPIKQKELICKLFSILSNIDLVKETRD